MRAVLVGEASDAHIRAVVDALRAGRVEPDLIDSASDRGACVLDPAAHLPEPSEPTRGLIRSMPTTPLDLLPIELHAWSDFADAIVFDPEIEWLSGLAAIRQADNKLHQLQLAKRAGVAFPRTLVPSTVADIRQALGSEVVLKPLGAGVIADEATPMRVFYSTLLESSSLTDAELARAPVLAQQPIRADRHLRVVTVHDQVWCAALPADAVAFDWRSSPSGTRLAWAPCTAPDGVVAGALRLNSLAGIGFSSQDWLDAAGSYYFIDLNPNGKWLFLPGEVAQQVTVAIARWLCRAE